jgi:hypothetical protein
MKNTVGTIFMILGAVFLLLIVIGIIFFIADPYEIRPLLFDEAVQTQNSTAPTLNTQSATETSTSSTLEGEVVGGFALSSAQIEALVSLGIDPAVVPSTISAAQEECFVGVLGSARVQEIKAGAVPNALEFLKAKSCI